MKDKIKKGDLVYNANAPIFQLHLVLDAYGSNIHIRYEHGVLQRNIERPDDGDWRKPKPILFNTEMVRAILDDRKTMTRREIDPQPFVDESGNLCQGNVMYGQNIEGPHWQNFIEQKAKYQPGDILYVRETFWQFGFWYYPDFGEGSKYDNEPEWRGFDIKFVADAPEKPTEFPFEKQGGFWRKIPSIHMPKALARTFLRVTAVKAERLQDITEADAIAEGCQSGGDWETAPTILFSKLWESTYGPGTFDERYVFAYTFERTDAPHSIPQSSNPSIL